VDGPLAPYADGFRAELERLGYTPLTAATHVRLMAHLSRWLAREGVEAAGLTPVVVEAYFAERRAAGYAGHVTGRALRPLAGYLRRLGVIPPPAPAVMASAEERLLTWYRDYLLAERGLAGTTAELNVRMVRPFLAGRVHETDAGVGLGHLTAGEVATFVVTQSRQRPKSVKRMVTALRSLLGFLHAEGLIGQPLAVPSPAGWTQTGLPKALDGDQVAALLASCDPLTRTGRRDLAILTLLARLGLRAGEVAGLSLEDIDWRRGEITVRGKGNRHDRLPLPADVGQRIVAYLHDGRPQPPRERQCSSARRPRTGR
jgi:site-specific recombinase XerD